MKPTVPSARSGAGRRADLFDVSIRLVRPPPHAWTLELLKSLEPLAACMSMLSQRIRWTCTKSHRDVLTTSKMLTLL